MGRFGACGVDPRVGGRHWGVVGGGVWSDPRHDPLLHGTRPEYRPARSGPHEATPRPAMSSRTVSAVEARSAGRSYPPSRVTTIRRQAEPSREGPERTRDAAVARLGHLEIGQWVGAMRVEPGREEDGLRGERFDCGEQGLRPRRHETLVAISGPERNVVLRPLCLAASTLAGVPGPRIEGRLVGRGVAEVGISVEDGLRAIAVMDVPVDDGDALSLVPRPAGRRPRARCCCRGRSRPHASGRGVMAGRPHRGHGDRRLAGGHGDRAPGSSHRRRAARSRIEPGTR